MHKISSVGVIGAGQMGAGIAQVSAMAGFKSLIWDLNPDATGKALKGIETQLTKQVEKGKLTVELKEKTLQNLSIAKSMGDMKACDLAIEAVTENFEIKAKIFKELDSTLAKDAILATNTSSISNTKVAGVTSRPEKVMGMHFMNPVPIMKLVEIIRGLQTSDETFDAVKAASEAMGKICVSAKDSPGFTVNRILVPMVNEAIYLLQEGNRPEDIDQAMVLGTNQPMGPLALADLVGLDTLLFIAQVLHRELGEDKYRPCPLLVKYVEAGWFGRKTKRGFYKYE